MAFDFPNAPTVGQTYLGYVWDGEKWMSISSPAAPNQSGVIAIQVFTASGQYIPSANMTTCVIEVRGGGGGGGGTAAAALEAGGGGGQGGRAIYYGTAATIGISQAITIGAGGTAGTSAAGGGPGGTTSVGALASASGGNGGVSSNTGGATAPGGAGGVGTAGAALFTGQGGGASAALVSALYGGIGGGEGGGRQTVAGAGVNGANGGGGSGASSSAAALSGGVGGNGYVIVTEYGMTALSPATAQLGSVRYDLPQGLTANQTAQARANIWVTKKNYIINGGMMISQENGTATVGTISNTFPADQFSINFTGTSGTLGANQLTPANSVTTPGGSPNRIQVYVGTPDATVGATDGVWYETRLEGVRIADLQLGKVTAKTFTIQFGVRCGLAGTYSVTVRNTANNRSYAAEYTISAGEVGNDVIKSVTIPGETTGTWNVDNTLGMYIFWGLMCGTTYQVAPGSWSAMANAIASTNQVNWMGAPANTIFQLFDVGLYEGSVAPPFQVPDYASELALCQRYFQRLDRPAIYGYAAAGGGVYQLFTISPMRATPTTTYVGTAPAYSNASALALVPFSSSSYRMGITITALGSGFADGNGGTVVINARL